MERIVDNLIYEYPEIFESICKNLKLKNNDNVESYTKEEIKLIFDFLKREHINIWKEM